MPRATLLIVLLWTCPLLAGGRMVIVVGAEGEAEYKPGFTQWADRFAAAATKGGVRVTRIGQEDTGSSTARTTATSPTTAPTTSPATDKQRLQAALIDPPPTASDPLWLVLIGHGTSDGLEAKFNLRGSDVSDKELAEWLRPMKGPIAVLNCSSASGPFLNELSAANRVVVTATRSGSEFQYARFGDYLSSAIADPTADLDKDGQTSVLEAFLYASHRVADFYKQSGRIVTEHALLDDNGDALGVSSDWFQGIRPTRSPKNGEPVDGAAAHRWVLCPSRTEKTLTPERLARREAIEKAIDRLREQKKSMPADVYYARLEPLLIELAKLYE